MWRWPRAPSTGTARTCIGFIFPRNEHSIFVRVPLPDGDIDYRFAVNAMQDAGYDGYLAIEGAVLGDQLHADRRSVEYVQGILAEPR